MLFLTRNLLNGAIARKKLCRNVKNSSTCWYISSKPTLMTETWKQIYKKNYFSKVKTPSQANNKIEWVIIVFLQHKNKYFCFVSCCWTLLLPGGRFFTILKVYLAGWLLCEPMTPTRPTIPLSYTKQIRIKALLLVWVRIFIYSIRMRWY